MSSFFVQFEKEDVGYCEKLSGVRESQLLAESAEGKKKERISSENRGEHISNFSK